jgi:hypothetical protein
MNLTAPSPVILVEPEASDRIDCNVDKDQLRKNTEGDKSDRIFKHLNHFLTVKI